jgi:hypothetical protein
MQPPANALSRIQRAARLVEYDLWRSWPIRDHRPGVIEDHMPWMNELAQQLDPDDLELVTYELVDHVLYACAPSLDPYVHLIVWGLLLERVDRNPAIARALAEG